MAALLALLLLLVVPSTAFMTTDRADVYYVTTDDATGHERLCPLHQICHNLSYYISQPDYYFTSDTTFIFLEGEHTLDREYPVHVSNIHNLTLKGQGQWPVAGAEETVMQSTVIIKCVRGLGGFYFSTSYDITVEGLTVVHCGGLEGKAVFTFSHVENLFFHKNSIQYMTGYGLHVCYCDNASITNCSYFRSILCDPDGSGAVGILFEGSAQHPVLELSHSNMTRCCSFFEGGGVQIQIFGRATVILSHLVVFNNSAKQGGGGIAASLRGDDSIILIIRNCFLSHGYGYIRGGGGIFFDVNARSKIIIQNTNLVENHKDELLYTVYGPDSNSLFLVNSTIIHTGEINTLLDPGVQINGCCPKIIINSTRIRGTGFSISLTHGAFMDNNLIQMIDCQFEGTKNVRAILYVSNPVSRNLITNCTFSNNKATLAVIVFDCEYPIFCGTITNSSISDNNATGITITKGAWIQFRGYNVIQNNRNKEGAGIRISGNTMIEIDGELLLSRNIAFKKGGAMLVKNTFYDGIDGSLYPRCTVYFKSNSSRMTFSRNRADSGGSDVYGAILSNCLYHGRYIPYVGHPNETSWYFDTPIMKHFHFSDADKLSSMSSDPIMVCFCNTTTNLPDCSDRTHYIQTYPGLEINTSIATVGRYGGTSPGDVQVTAQYATLVRYYGQNQTTNCFQLHILLQNTSSTTALVDIRVDGGLHNWSVSIGVDILECPIGFTQMSGQCQCERILEDGDVQCKVQLSSAISFRFLRSGNSWFGYSNKTQCVTGTTSCPFDYCNRSNVSFDIMAPDRQCVANRTGIFCGQCHSHLSIMLGSNHCGTCSNWHLFLLPVFALAGIVLVAMLMFLNLSVSVGTINGLLFYANMVKLNEAFFFPNGSVPVVSQFISWLNLDLGIEVCLFNGLDGYWNTWLQFVFPAYLFLLMGGIIVGCRYSVWLCRLCGSHAVPALATLFLMSYTKILLTVTNALSMSQLPCNVSILTVWSVDGNIEYGSGKHLVLVVVSCGILVIGLAYPVLVLCAPLLERYSHKCIPQHRWNPVAKFKPLLDAYGGPYKDRYRFWTGVTLMVRLVATVTFSFTSGGLAVINASIITTVVVGILTFWSFTKGVYKKLYLNALGAFYLLNTFLLSNVSLATASLKPRDVQIGTIVSVCLSLAACIVTIATHLRWNFDLKKIKRRLGCKDRPEYIEVPQVSADENDEEDRSPLGSSPSIVYGSHRGEHQFELEFRSSSHDSEEPSPVLLAREPLLFDI